MFDFDRSNLVFPNLSLFLISINITVIISSISWSKHGSWLGRNPNEPIKIAIRLSNAVIPWFIESINLIVSFAIGVQWVVEKKTWIKKHWKRKNGKNPLEVMLAKLRMLFLQYERLHVQLKNLTKKCMGYFWKRLHNRFFLAIHLKHGHKTKISTQNVTELANAVKRS